MCAASSSTLISSSATLVFRSLALPDRKDVPVVPRCSRSSRSFSALPSLVTPPKSSRLPPREAHVWRHRPPSKSAPAGLDLSEAKFRTWMSSRTTEPSKPPQTTRLSLSTCTIVCCLLGLGRSPSKRTLDHLRVCRLRV